MTIVSVQPESALKTTPDVVEDVRLAALAKRILDALEARLSSSVELSESEELKSFARVALLARRVFFFSLLISYFN